MELELKVKMKMRKKNSIESYLIIDKNNVFEHERSRSKIKYKVVINFAIGVQLRGILPKVPIDKFTSLAQI